MRTSITKILSFLIVILCSVGLIALAGSPTIFEGDKVLNLKQNIDLNRQFYILSGGLSPSGTAVAANRGSLYMSRDSNVYKKNDDGLTTNWSALSTFTGRDTPPFLAYFSQPNGDLTTLPNIFRNSYGGISNGQDLVPDLTNPFYTAETNITQTNISPSTTVSALNNTINQSMYLNIDPSLTQTSDLGDKINLNMAMQHQGNGSNGNLKGINSSVFLGGGGYASSYVGQNMFTGIGITYTVANYSDLNIGSNISGNVQNYTSVMINPAGTGTISGNATGISFNFGDLNATNGKTAASFNFGNAGSPNFSTMLDLNGGTGTYGSVLKGLNINMNNASSNFEVGATIGKSNGPTALWKGLEITSGGGGATNATGIDISMDNVSSPNIKAGINVSGGVYRGGYSLDVPTSTPAFFGNLLNSQFDVTAAPVAGTWGVMNALPFAFVFSEDMGSDGTGLGLGVSNLGFLGQVIGTAGKTADTLNMEMAGFSSPAGAGVIDKVNMYRALGAISAGGALSINNMKAFKADTILCSIANNCWGMSIEDPNAHNWAAGDFIVGTNSTPATASVGIEITNTAKAFLNSRMTTPQRDALTAVNGMQIFNVDSNQLECYSNNTWGTCAGGAGSGTVTSVNATVPGPFVVSGVPITTSGSIDITISPQGANTVYAGPTSGAPAVPQFRFLQNADLPVVDVPHGGTAQSSLTSNALLVGNGVGPVSFVSPGANGDCLQVVGGVWTSVACSGGGGSSTVTASAAFKYIGGIGGPVQVFDGQHVASGTETLKKVALSMSNSGTSGSTDIVINHTDSNGNILSPVQTVSLNATGFRASTILTLGTPITCSAGDMIWPDITNTPQGFPQDLNVEFLFQ